MENPFLQPYHTPHGTVPFNKIALTDYEPAIREGMRREDEEIRQITDNPEKPTFSNTIQALEQSGELLERVTTVMFNLMSAETCDELEAIAERLMPELSEHSNNISLNETLFKRIKYVYDTQDQLTLTSEERRLLEKTYDGFVRSGANLSDADKETYRKLSMELSTLTLRFSQNHLKETNNYELYLTAAEAECRLSEEAAAKEDLSAVMSQRVEGYTCTKTGTALGKLTSDVTGSLLEEIITQRRIELWGEFGRIYDIRRLKQGFVRTSEMGWPLNAQLTNRPSDNPESYMWVLTIPQTEFDGNASMNPATDQNPIGDTK